MGRSTRRSRSAPTGARSWPGTSPTTERSAPWCASRGRTGFGAPIVVVPAPRNGSGFGFSLSDESGPEELPNLQAAIAPDGRVRLAWPRKGGGVATATLAGAAVVERQMLGGRLRGAEGLSLLTLADGRGALAWINHEDTSEDSPARQHYAVEGAADAPRAGHAAESPSARRAGPRCGPPTRSCCRSAAARPVT